MKNPNPFLINQYLKPKYFCSRNEEFQAILNKIEKDKNILLLSRNGLGKTTLINHVFYQLSKEKKYEVILIDALAYSSVENLLLGFLNILYSKAANTSKKKAKKLKKIVFDKIDEEKLNFNIFSDVAIKQKIIDTVEFFNEGKKKTIIAIDNYHLAFNYQSRKFDDLVISTLLNCNNTNVLLSGTKSQVALNNFEVIEIEKIRTNDFRKFILAKFEEDNRKISDKSIDLIFNFSKMETKTVIIICSFLWESGERKIKSKHVKVEVEKIINFYSSSFSLIKPLLSQYQWKLLLAIATEEEAVQVTSANFIKQYKLNAPSSVKTALDALTEKELIYKSENAYLISDSLLSFWLRQL